MGNLVIKQQLTKLIKEGVSFEVSQDKLLVKGNLKALDAKGKNFLKTNKQEIISLIESSIQEVPVISRISSNFPIPLSFSQQGLWLLDKINNGSHHYNLTSTFKIKGKINYKALNQTFLTLLQRHESLRSCFFLDESGEPFQRVQTVTNFEVIVEELNVALEDYESIIKKKIEEEATQKFDLTKDLLLAVRLIKLTREEHILIITMHHIASDGWSMGILVKEFNTLYTNYVKGEPNSLPALEIQFSDYAYWQRNWLKDEILEKQVKYWKKRLCNLPTLHNLPLDRPRPILQNFKGNVYSSIISYKVLKSLNEFCWSETASLFMGIHAVFSVFLARYSNETDIVIGSPIANREKIETSKLVGFFMNLLVLRSDLSKAPNFKELIRQSKKNLQEAYQYQQMPFEKLVEELKVQRNLNHNPLFQILLTLQNDEMEKFSISDVVMEPVHTIQTSAKYDLSLNIIENSEQLRLLWEYNTDLFDESTIARMASHFNSLLVSLLENPDKNVFKIDMIGEKEALKINEHLKGNELKIINDDHVIKSFEFQAVNQPDEIAIISNDISCNYRDLGELIDSVANILLDQGVKKGDKVGICLLRNVELIAAIFACFKVGAAYIPLDPVYPSKRIAQIINDACPSCIVTLKPLKKLYLNTLLNEKVVFLDKIEIQQERNKLMPNYGYNHLAYIIFTSGTTGKPKGIEITHRNLSNLLKGFDTSLGTQTKQRWLAQTSINFDISVLELIWTISRGQTIVLQQSNPIKLLSREQLMRANNINFSVMFFGADKSKEQRYDLLLKTAVFADENKFDAIWTPERHFSEFGGAFPNPSVISAALSVLTKNINIRSGSVVLPLHDPVRVAEEWSLVDNLSNGRIGLSIASGWQPDDFVFSNSDYMNRHKEMREKIVELKNLWKGNPINRKNGINGDFSIKIRPRPIQEDLPIWITAAGSPETFKYAGEIGANLLTHMLGQSMEKLADNISIYHEALKKNGFNIEDKKVSLMLHTYIDSSEKIALGISEKPFKEYLGSSIKLMEPLAEELGIDINTQRDELINLAFKKFSQENTLIGSPESCQKLLFNIQNIGITEVACLVDFGVESQKVLAGLEMIAETRDLYNSYKDLFDLLNVDKQKTELDLINDYKLTHLQMTPSQSKLVLDLYKQTGDRDLSSVQNWYIGGEALSQNLIKGLSNISNCKFYNMYGPTETTVWSAWREISKEDIHIGGPIANTHLLLLNEFEQQVPVGVVGELYIGGLGVAKGYNNNVALTKERFKHLKNPYFGKGRFYKTGDLMKLKTYGILEYVGRKDSQVKVNGYRVELEEIENMISKVPGIKSVKVVPIVDNHSATLSAYIVKEDIVYGDFKKVSSEKQAKPFHFPDGSIIYHQSDRQLAMLYKEVIEDGVYFKNGITIPENGLVFDIGANIGAFSIDVSQRYPSATIIAFEPIPDIFSALKKNFEYRQIKGRVLNYGASNKKENAIFHYYPEMAGMSGRFADEKTIIDAVEQYINYDKNRLKNDNESIAEENRKFVESVYDGISGSNDLNKYLSSLYKAEDVECQLTTVSDIIDELNIQAIDLLKLDVEKSECLVLEGIRQEHWKMIRQLVVEVDGNQNLTTIEQLLTQKGYNIITESLILSDSNAPNTHNTYMLYATNHAQGAKQNDTILKQLQVQANEINIKDFLKKNLPDYMIPNEIIFTPSIPLMENGKVDIVELRKIKSKKLDSNELLKLTNETELTIYRIWCEILKKETIPNHISIFEAGGNSMQIVLLHEKLQKEFKINFSLVELFRNPTVTQQAKLIKNSGNTEIGGVKKAIEKGAARRQVRTVRNKTI